MILVDTSAWIDFLRASDTVVAAELTGLIVAGEDLATTEAVVMELLTGADTPIRADAIEKLTNGLPILGTDPRLDFGRPRRCFSRRAGTERAFVAWSTA